MRPVHLAYQPPASSTFLSEQISHQQPVLFSHNKSAPAISQTNRLMSLASILIYSSWNIRKERNLRAFDSLTALPARVLTLIQEELKLHSLACGRVVDQFLSLV
jgi:hypothetical protein